MESDARPPEKLSDEGPMARNWKRWKQNFLIYMKLTGGMNKPEDEKAAWLKNLIGQVGLEALETISFDSPDDKENMTIIIQKLEELFDPPKNEVEERNKFFSRPKKSSESIDAYIENLKVISKLCNFRDQVEDRVIDAVILNMKDTHLRKILFEEKDLDLEKLKIIYKTYTLNNARTKGVSKESIPEEAKSLQKRYVQKKPSFAVMKEPKNPCWRCGEKHALRECPAFRNRCCYCENYNHFSHRCPVAKLDSIEISAPGTNVVSTKPNNSASAFGIEKDSKSEKGYKNNLNPFPNDDKEKSIPKHETLKSGRLVKNVEIVHSRNPKKVENQFSTRSNPRSNLEKVTSQHPLSPTRTGMQPSTPPESLMDLKIQKPTTQLSMGKQVFQTKKNKSLGSSEEGQKYKTLKSDPLVKDFEIVDSGDPKKVQNQFSTFGKVTSQHPLSPTRTGMQPSAPPKYLLDLNVQKPTTQLSTGKQEFPIHKNKLLESSEKVENASQSDFHVSRPQNSQPSWEYAPLYPKLPNSAPPVSRYFQNNLQSNDRLGIPHNAQYAQPNYVSSSANLREEPVKPKRKPESDCLIS